MVKRASSQKKCLPLQHAGSRCNMPVTSPTLCSCLSRDKTHIQKRRDRGQSRRMHVRQGINDVAIPCEQPVTTPIVVTRLNRDLASSHSGLSSDSPCVTDDLLTVEQSIRELLDGYHRIIDDYCGKWDSDDALSSSEAPPTHGTTCARGDGGSNSNTTQRGYKTFNPSDASYCSKIDVRSDDTSLPVSSVHRDHSTDAKSPIPYLQMRQGGFFSPQREVSSALSNETVHLESLGTAAPSARVGSPVDLFADVLTEDQLSRSRELQGRHRDKTIDILKQQLGASHSSEKRRPTSPARQLSWNSTLLVDTMESSNEVEKTTRMGFGAMWYPSRRDVVCSPVPPDVWQRISKTNTTSRSRSMSGNTKTDHYDTGGKVFVASKWREESASLPGCVTVANRYNVAFMSPVQNADLPTPHNGIVDSGEGSSPKGSADCPVPELSGKSQNNSFGKLEVQRLLQKVCSSERKNGGDSITPEIATSARRTENHSTRSGVMPGDQEKAAEVPQKTTDRRHCTSFQPWDGKSSDEVEGKVPKIRHGSRLSKYSEAQGQLPQPPLHSPQERTLYYASSRCCSPPNRNAASRFRENVERCVAAVESNDGTITALPHFADSLVGAAISDLFPAVKRRQALLKQSQHAQEAAAVAAARTMRSSYRASFPPYVSTANVGAALRSNTRCVHGVYPYVR
uniref:WGS project CAEQ00000000 data, annotated contig 1086 n=1 Tax=Trypanosoma congolense (strain IL3000) TaxID=1068625 RepID=F9W3P3_TRYCI|nr:unnamed protein product [Trypanosoma congolense IL3000]